MSTAPKTLTVTECHQLLDALICKDGTKKQFRKGIRNYLMALLMLDAGLRVGEVVRLKYLDLYFGASPVSMIIIGLELAEKDCERQIPVSSRLSAAIETMTIQWWKCDPLVPSDYAFYTNNETKPLTTRQVERIIRAAAMKCLGRPVHPHVLRHTFASRLMRKTNSRVVQELLGHKNLSSTQIYTHPNGEDLKEAIDAIEGGDAESQTRADHVNGALY